MYGRYLLYAFVIYLLYRLIFHFIIPVYKTTKQVKKQFRDIHSKMEEQMNGFTKPMNNGEKQGFESKKSTPTKQGGDYIDFEEVK